MRLLPLLLVLCILFADSPQGHAQDSSPPPPPIIHTPISVTVSGGVSLGSYEAGFLYYISEFIKKNGEIANLKMVTGASAGSINSVLTIMSVCDPKPTEPKDSLFWTTWRDIGFDQLFISQKVTPTGAFSRDAFRNTIQRIRTRWNQGLPHTCDVVLGLTATRLQAHPISVRNELLSIPRTRENIAVRIQGQGPGKLPRVTNYRPARRGAQLTLLPLDDPNADPFALLEQVSLASSAFPIAFQPEPIQTCVRTVERDNVLPKCTLDDSTAALFIDGGVFDNQPLGIAADIIQAGLYANGPGWAWRDHPTHQRNTLPERVFFFALNPELTAWPDKPENSDITKTPSVLSMGSYLASSFVQSARSEELLDLFQKHPSLRNRIALGQSHFPHASNLLGAFFGFFDRGLREYDFHLGMVDARLFITHQIHESFYPSPEDANVLPKSLESPDPAWSGDLQSISPQWRPFFCIRGILEDRDDFLQACSDDALLSTRILAQTSLNRLYNHCRKLHDTHTAIQHTHCKRAASGSAPPQLQGLPKTPQDFWIQRSDEANFNYMLRLLERYQYTFHDLGLRSDQSHLAVSRIHQRIRNVGASLASVHDDPADKALIYTATRLFANSIQYIPTHTIFYAALGDQVEFGLSSNTLWSDSTPWLRLHSSLAFDGVGALRSSSTGVYGVTLSAGLLVEPISWNSAEVQLRFGARSGLLLSAEDALFSQPCTRTDTRQNRAACSRLITETFATLSFLSRLRAQLTATFTPTLRANMEPYWAISPSLGVQF